MIGFSHAGPMASATSVIRYEGILGTKISPPQACSSACMTISTPSCNEMLNRVISATVIGKTPFSCFRFMKNGITDPFDPMTFP